MALIASLARVARSTNRSTPYHSDHQRPVTEGYRPPGRSARARTAAPEKSQTLLTAKPLDLDYKHEIIRRVHQERDQAPALRAEMKRAQRH